MNAIVKVFFVAALLTGITCQASWAADRITDLKVGYTKNPVGIDDPRPVFSWKMESDIRGTLQTAYQLTVSADEAGENIVWNSGKVASGKSVHIPYDGTALQASTRYFWNVSVWNQAGAQITSTENAYFETGLMNSGWGNAKWIKSIEDVSISDETDNLTQYSLSVDFEIVNIAAGIIFGYKDNRNFFMWQINLEKQEGRTFLRPHSWKDGGAANHADLDITNLITIQKGVTYTMRIDVDGNLAKTYINNILVDERINPRGGNYGYGLTGFRMNKSEKTSDGEEGYFDNMRFTSLDNSTVYFFEDFSNPARNPFTYGEVRNGRYYVLGSLSAPLSVQVTNDDGNNLNYDLETDLTLVNHNAGIIFNAHDKSNYYMWQINCKDNAQPMIRRHFYKNGSPSVSEALFGSVFSKEDLLNKEVHLKIEVRAKTIKTFINDQLVDTYQDATGPSVAKRMGFRAHKDANVDEIAYYDNVKITEYIGEQAVVHINEDFEGASGLFDGGERITHNGSVKLKIYSKVNETRVFDDTMDATLIFRTGFSLNGTIKSARLYSTALGVYEVYINGKRVGTPTDKGMAYDELKPGWTDYRYSLFYTTYDVTKLLQNGVNAMGANVASGWWSGEVSHGRYGRLPGAFLARLVVEYTDGTKAEIVTNPSDWKVTRDGPIRLGDIYDGETYDARREMDWSDASFDDKGWLSTAEAHYYQGRITAFVGPPVQVRHELERTPLTITRYKGSTPDGNGHGMVNVTETLTGNTSLLLKPGETVVYDLGQNMVGWVRVKLKGAAGTRVRIRFAEMLNDNGSTARVNDGPGGSLYRVILRSAKTTINYTLKGDPDGEIYAPSTTFFGFRYCDIETSADVQVESLKGEVVGSATEEGSSFVTSNESVNKLYQNTIWGQRGNFLSIPTDCPQRDERLGWTGDILAFGNAAAYNADISGFLRKWMGDMRDSQREDGAYPDVAPFNWGVGHGNSAWAEAGIVVPWVIYQMYGNTGILEENYASMEKYMNFLAAQVFDGYKYNGAGTAFGDWVSYEGTDKRYISVCFYAYAAQLMEKISRALSTQEGDSYDLKANQYNVLNGNIKAEFQTRYVYPNGSLKQRSQTAYLLALKLNLFPNEEARQNGITTLNNYITANGNKLSTGFVGTAILNQTLSESGLTNTAYNLLLQRGNPSWLYSVDQGATTIWERWNGYTKESGFHPDISMNSFNHYAYGAVAEWMYRYMAGINPNPENPGFKHILITPHPDRRTTLPQGQERITSVDATYNSYYGPVRSAWNSNGEGEIVYSLNIPANTTARVVLTGYTSKDIVKVNGMLATDAEGVLSESREGENIIIEIGSGSYTITIDTVIDSTPKAENTTGWEIFPNPVKNFLSMRGMEAVEQVKVFGLSGNLMYSQTNDRPINMAAYPSGVYLVEIGCRQGNKNWMIVKE